MINRHGEPSGPLLPAGQFYFAVAPVLPFLLGTGVMQLFAPATPLDLDSAMIRQTVAFSHLGEWLIYASAVCLQLATCAGAISFHLLRIRKLDVAARRGAYWEARFAERVLQLQSSFQASSLVLVTSTVALMLMVQLPVGLADESTREALSRFALGLTVYWGSIMTLTLFAVFAPPLVALRREASNHHRAIGIEQTFGEWLDQRKYFSFRRHLTNLATMIAPVLVGPVGMLIESMLSG